MRRGFAIFLTGLSGSGKSTIATALVAKMKRPVSVLDGDLMRSMLSPDLGFSRADREINIRRIGFVAQQVVWCGGVAICACIAPYDSTRKEVRHMIEREGGRFCLAHIATPLPVCEERDPKGLYAQARAGYVQKFTGISDPYEVPDDADIVIDTRHLRPEQAASKILSYVRHYGQSKTA